ncbi:hypothetical protein FHG87_020062 [Trinorchestia longiramus]|nr:hypothetical protein FHG87_020062 [Trinorchestia longiramus]
MTKKRQRRDTSLVSSSGGDSDAWASIDSASDCISPISKSSHDIGWPLPKNRGYTGELLEDQQLSLFPIPVIEINPNKNMNQEVIVLRGLYLNKEMSLLQFSTLGGKCHRAIIQLIPPLYWWNPAWRMRQKIQNF